VLNRCAKCNAENPPPFKFCGECGAPLQAGSGSQPQTAVAQMTSAATHFAEKRSIDAREVSDGERKTVTALFADIKGSTELKEELDNAILSVRLPARPG
jgi:class 3 adenylate cyclase